MPVLGRAVCQRRQTPCMHRMASGSSVRSRAQQAVSRPTRAAVKRLRKTLCITGSVRSPTHGRRRSALHGPSDPDPTQGWRYTVASSTEGSGHHCGGREHLASTQAHPASASEPRCPQMLHRRRMAAVAGPADTSLQGFRTCGVSCSITWPVDCRHRASRPGVSWEDQTSMLVRALAI